MQLNEITADLFLFLTSFRRSLGHETFDAKWVKSRVKNLLELAERRAQGDPETYRLFTLVKYPLVVAADGIILNSGWSASDEWSLLEVDLFGTANGGERFFELIEDAQYRDPQVQELLYTCLAVGFSGKHSGDAFSLRTVRQSIFHKLPNIPRDGEGRITPAAYERAAMEGRRILPMVSVLRMSLVVLGVMVVLGVASHFMYRGRVDDLITASDVIAEAGGQRK